MDGLVQEKRNSIANAVELRLSCHTSHIWANVDQIPYGISRAKLFCTSSFEFFGTVWIILHRLDIVLKKIYIKFNINDVWQLHELVSLIPTMMISTDLFCISMERNVNSELGIHDNLCVIDGRCGSNFKSIVFI